ncbi:MAG: ABC transporter permease [Chloroflexi bacterium]|nr:ABC transporter permease [Chloroflexota bacterium]
MRAYIIRRLITGIFILFILSVVIFVLMRLAPGDPAILACGLNASPECIEAKREQLGLNDSWPVQYGNWIRDVSTGDLGVEAITHRPVIDTLKDRFPVTLELLIITMVATIAIGVPFGIISALYRNSPADYGVRITAVMGLSVPNFWLATLVIIIPQELWGYAPTFARSISFTDDPVGNLQQFVPPALVLAMASAAGIMRLTRSSLLEVMGTDYVRTARSKGLRESLVVSRHALKNSMIPVVTVLGLQIAFLLGGTVIIERIFALPGVGLYLFESLLSKDFQVVQSLTVLVGAVVISMNLLVDIVYAWLDPRIRYA